MPIEIQPVVKGELVELVELRPLRADDLYAVAAQPLIREQHPVGDRYRGRQPGPFRASDSHSPTAPIQAENAIRRRVMPESRSARR